MPLVNSQRNLPKRDTATDERFPCGLQYVLLASCAAVAGVTLHTFFLNYRSRNVTPGSRRPFQDERSASRREAVLLKHGISAFSNAADSIKWLCTEEACRSEESQRTYVSSTRVVVLAVSATRSLFRDARIHGPSGALAPALSNKAFPGVFRLR